MKVVLRSDYNDFYDHWFDILLSPDEPHIIFERFSGRGFNRPEQFLYLTSQGVPVPRYGSPAELLGDCPCIVVYDDIEAHRGSGKRLVTSVADIGQATFASEYLWPGPKAISHRLLAIGCERYHLVYQSDDDWRSNVGDVTIEPGVYPLPDLKTPNFPLYAIDFILATRGPVAIDFNTAPGLRWTGLEMLRAKDVAEAIKQWLR